MGGASIPRGIARSVPAALLLACASVVAATQPGAASLTAVDVIETAPGFCRLLLEVRGRIRHVDTIRIGDGRFVFDLSPVAWNGPTRRVRPDTFGIHEYRFSQFSRDPLVTRLVVEVGSGWSCLDEPDPNGLMVVCSGPAAPEAHALPAPGPTIAVVRGFELTSPVAGLDAEQLVDRSLAFTPSDIVKDGLPSFGSMRDDWIGSPRRHQGLDIYVDKISIQAVAEGKIFGTGRGERAGGWVKISHGNGVETVYVHVKGIKVKDGDAVAKGQPIAAVDGAVGNAVEPQLHFELRLDGQSVDPVPYMYEQASEDLRRKITRANQRLAILEEERASRIRQGSSR